MKGTDVKRKANLRLHTLRRFVDVGLQHFGLASSAHHVWFVIWANADFDGYCTISHSRIVASTGLGYRTVSRCIKQLVETKAITLVAKGSSSKGASKQISKYRIHYFSKRKAT